MVFQRQFRRNSHRIEDVYMVKKNPLKNKKVISKYIAKVISKKNCKEIPDKVFEVKNKKVTKTIAVSRKSRKTFPKKRPQEYLVTKEFTKKLFEEIS